MLKRYTFYFIVFVVMIVLPSTLFSAETEEKTLDDFVITATRTPTSLEKVGGSSVSVVTAEDIEVKKQTQIRELLKDIPGVDIAGSGGPGSSSSIFIRGSESKSVLVLIDGVMVNNPSDPNRSADIGTLTADNIERIEVIRGSQSVLYGSNATAGVVNIITKKGQGKPVITTGVEAGSYGTTKYFGGARGKSGALSYAINGAQNKSDGYSIANKRNKDIPQGGNTNEKDGWENLNLSMSLGYELSETFDLSLTVNNMTSSIDLDDYGSGYAGDRLDYNPTTWAYVANPTGQKDRHTDLAQQYISVQAHNFFMDRTLESTLSYNTGSNTRKSFDQDNEQTYEYIGTSNETAWQGTFFIGETQELTFGLSSFKEEMKQTAFSGGVSNTEIEKSATTSSYWVQDQTFLMDEALVIVVGARSDNHEKFGSAATYRLAPSYKLKDTGTLFKMSYGTGFQAPSLYELFSSYGNEDLDASKSTTSDIGIEQSLSEGHMKVGVTLFNSEFTDAIAFDMSTFKFGQQEGKSKTSGWEAFFQTEISDHTDLTINHAALKTEDAAGDPLLRKPENKTGISGSTRFLEKAQVSYSVYNVGKRTAYSGSRDKNGKSIKELPAYMLVNLAASYALLENLDLYGRIDNLADTFYEEAWSYATPGRSYYVGIKAMF
ncbi:MAG: TonB-dependent receptor [Deltaproteobacteria bacterium]|nr:TonB-dependent receptor [Deltaproteobacteria bacterium]